MSLDQRSRKALSRFAARARPFSGVFFRTVEYRFMDPANLLGGRGTQLYGGRFVPPGIRAVYFAESDAAASQEVLARKKRLGGNSQITLQKYPRIVFAVEIRLDRLVSFIGKDRSALLEGLRQASLVHESLATSQAVGAALQKLNVQAILFPSVVNPGRNLVVFLDNCPVDVFTIVNQKELRRKIQQMAGSNL